jgi:hypothetical protein
MNPYDLPLKTIEDLVEEHGTPLYIVVTGSQLGGLHPGIGQKNPQCERPQHFHPDLSENR